MVDFIKYTIKQLLVIFGVFLSLCIIFFWGLIETQPKIIVINKVILVDSSKTHKMFLEKMGKVESGGDYKKINPLGYLGKYQFGLLTIRGLNFKCTQQEFINQPKLQEDVMLKNLLTNKKQLHKFIGRYQFKMFRGVYITESGILAAAHLGGTGSVIKFFNDGNVFKDGNGVPITKYMKDFSSYNLEY